MTGRKSHDPQTPEAWTIRALEARVRSLTSLSANHRKQAHEASADARTVRQALAALLRASHHRSVCGYPEEVRFRCEACQDADVAEATAEALMRKG